MFQSKPMACAKACGSTPAGLGLDKKVQEAGTERTYRREKRTRPQRNQSMKVFEDMQTALDSNVGSDTI